MTPTPQQYYDRAVAAADDEGRLPIPEQSMWEIFPFEPDSLRVKPLEPLVLAVRVVRAVESLDAIGRVHVNTFGDGGAHLHVFLLGRPAGLLQLRGSNLALWEEMFPLVPADDTAAVLQVAVAALAGLGDPRG